MAKDAVVSGGRLVDENGEEIGLAVNADEVLTALGGPVLEVAVTAEAVHAALVTLGLITAPEE